LTVWRREAKGLTGDVKENGRPLPRRPQEHTGKKSSVDMDGEKKRLRKGGRQNAGRKGGDVESEYSKNDKNSAR